MLSRPMIDLMRPDLKDDPLPLSQAEWMRRVRGTLPCALAWRAMAELARRHHAQWDIAIEQFHPGASMAGAFGLSLLSKEDRRNRKRVAFHIGGASGTWSTEAAGHPNGDLSDLLAPEPARVIDRIEKAVGLPEAPIPVPASSQQVLGMRLTAGLLESLVFWRTSWRVSLGGYGYNGDCIIGDWARWLGVEPRDRGAHRDPEVLERLNECILIHQAEDVCPVIRQLSITGVALTLDLRTGIVGRIDSSTWKKLQQLGASNGMANDLIQKTTGELICQFVAR